VQGLILLAVAGCFLFFSPVAKGARSGVPRCRADGQSGTEIRGVRSAYERSPSPLLTLTPFSIGSTYYDLQHSTVAGRQIAVGCSGMIHNVWTNKDVGEPGSASRSIYYTSYLPDYGIMPPIRISDFRGGYATLDVTGAGFAVAAWHLLDTANVGASIVATESDCDAAVFSEFPFSLNGINCDGIHTGSGPLDGAYIWPIVAVDQDGSGNPIAHVVSTEYAAQDVLSLIYYRSNAGITAPDGSCGTFIDSVSEVSAVVVQDPNSQRVAIAYVSIEDNIVYRESDDLGISWGPRTSVTSYSGSEPEKAYCEVSALYTADGCLHLIWNTVRGDDLEASCLWHWDNCTECRSLMVDANNHDTHCYLDPRSPNVSRINLSECSVGATKRLYATYVLYTGDDTGVPGATDCSQGGHRNGEIYAQASDNGGSTWGRPVDLTNTYSNDCAAGECNSENWPSSAMYVQDSLRLQYILDKDAGAAAAGYGGTWTENPVMNVAVPCFAMSTYRHLTAIPTSFEYPFRSEPGQTKDTLLTLVNCGNAAASYSRTVTYVNGSGWLTFPDDPANGTVGSGCTFSDTLLMRVMGPSVEGLYRARISFIYNDGTIEDTLIVSVELFNFKPIIDCFPGTIRTQTNRLMVYGNGRLSPNGYDGFRYFSDSSQFLYEASLIIGNASNKLSWGMFQDWCPPTNSTDHGNLHYLSAEHFDSTSYSSYRYMTGRGCNGDSTVAFTCRYFAPKHPDSADFYVAHFDIYAGPKFTSDVADLAIAYATDWEAPSDSGIADCSGVDPDRQMIYMRGLTSSGQGNDKFAASAYVADDGSRAVGGFVKTGPSFWYPFGHVYGDFRPDSLWNNFAATDGFTASNKHDDLASFIVAKRGVTLSTADTISFSIILAAENGGTLSDLQQSVNKARRFICDHVVASTALCYICGDANSDVSIDISDAVCLIQYIFGAGPAPYPQAAGDANCDQGVDISDAVYLIQYIFTGGPTPCASCGR
jgi:hypothetical protein